jgi:hypothetical protein
LKPYLVSAKNVKFLGILLPLATKRLVTSVKSTIMNLLFALVVLVLLLILLRLRNNNHIVKGLMMTHPLIQ